MKTSKRLFLAASALSIGLWPGFVKAEPPTLDAEQKAALKGFIADLMKQGEDYKYDKERAKLFGLTPGSPTKTIEVDSEEISDGYFRTVELVMDRSVFKLKPHSLFLLQTREDSSALTDESRNFRLSPDGKLKQIMIVRGRLHPNGKVVRGSGKAEFIKDLGQPWVKEELQRELDFWLKGMYRKTPKAASSDAKGDALSSAKAETGSSSPGAGSASSATR